MKLCDWEKEIFDKDAENPNYTYLDKFDLDALGKIRELRLSGVKIKTIAVEVGISYPSVTGICKKYGWQPKRYDTDNVVKHGRSFHIAFEDLKRPARIKFRLIVEKGRKPICEFCGWDYRDHPWIKNLNKNNIPLEIHHKDGNNGNNSLDNLELLCPNCHSMTKYYRTRNRKRYTTEFVKC